MQDRLIQRRNPATNPRVSGLAGGGIFALENLINLQHKYIDLANDAGYRSIIYKKERKYWEKKEAVYDRIMLRLNDKICKLLNNN
jgi:hypothetical protein